MAEDSVWRTWKPYAVIAVGAVAAMWWWNSQSSFARLKDGAYDCIAVYVNESGKYERVTDESGRLYYATAEVRNDKVVSLAGESGLSVAPLSSLMIRSKGDSHFHATDDPALKMYYAVACDYAGR